MKGDAKPPKATGDEQAQMAGVVARGGAFLLRAAALWAIPDPYKPDDEQRLIADKWFDALNDVLAWIREWARG